METIKHEIFSQSEALLKTKEQLYLHRDELCKFLKKPYKSIIFMGCGSGYMLSQNAAALFSCHSDKKAVALAGGEVMLNPSHYKKLFTDSLVIISSRSGETSEVAISIRELKKFTCFDTIGILAKEECTLKSLVDFSIDIPWAFDNSVCQTRNISNFYYALTMLFAFYTEDTELQECFSAFIQNQSDYLASIAPECQKIAAEGWNNVTVLADGDICGIASEGGLAFSEISILPGEHYRFLDYRHGPVVVADNNKLVIAVINPNDEAHQKKMINEIKNKGAFVISIGLGDKDFWQTDYHVSTASIPRFEVWGLAFINLCQVLAFNKALACGHDPDVPEGLNSFVKL